MNADFYDKLYKKMDDDEHAKIYRTMLTHAMGSVMEFLLKFKDENSANPPCAGTEFMEGFEQGLACGAGLRKEIDG